jgi:protocatechuate 3,4-dioxygenase alpha subunit
MMPRQTPSQTIGPFFHFALAAMGSGDEPAHVRQVEIAGRVLDGLGAGVPDALIETWQAASSDAKGCFARFATDDEGRFQFRIAGPRVVADPNGGPQAPHVAVGLFARGLLKRLVTRIYFEGMAENDRDLVLSLVPASRRATLVAKREAGTDRFRFDIVLQGPRETVFFDCQPRARRE